MICHRSVRMTAVAALIFLLDAGPAFAQAPASDSVKGITVSFKFDPGPTYGGPRWMPPPFTGGLQTGQGTVEVKVQGLDSSGKTVAITPEWTPADPEMVTVSPIRNDEFRIVVKHAGESKLKVSAQQVSRELIIKTKSFADGKAMKVEVSAPEASTQAPTAPAAAADGPKAEETAPAIDHGSVFVTSEGKQSYALGMNTGKQLRKQSIDVDSDLFIQGLKDGLAGGTTMLTDEDARAVILNLRLEVKKRQLASRQQVRPSAKLSDIKFAFKQNPKADEPANSAENWVSPPTYNVANGTFQAKVQALLGGELREINARWIPADREMVDISRGDGTAVRISVKRPGETKLRVASKGVSKELTIRARYSAANALQLEVSQ